MRDTWKDGRSGIEERKNRMLNNDALTVRANDITKLSAHNFRNHFDRFQSRSF